MSKEQGGEPIPGFPETINASRPLSFANRISCSASSYSDRTRILLLKKYKGRGISSGTFTTGRARRGISSGSCTTDWVSSVRGSCKCCSPLPQRESLNLSHVLRPSEISVRKPRLMSSLILDACSSLYCTRLSSGKVSQTEGRGKGSSFVRLGICHHRLVS